MNEPQGEEVARPAAADLRWSALPAAARTYVAVIIGAGAAALAWSLPFAIPRPVLFLVLVMSACLTSIWKINLPIPLVSGATLSVSYAADLTSLLLLGPRPAVVIAVAGAWTQCTVNVKQRYPLYRTVFSAAVEAITMGLTGLVYEWLGGPHGPFDLSQLPQPLVGAISTYFFVNTGLVAVAIALSSSRSIARVWRTDFLWSGASFFVAGGAGAVAAAVIDRGEQWKAILMLAPVYVTYWSYQVFVGRLEDQQRHEEHLAAALANMTRLKEVRNQLLEREQAARTAAEQANRLKDEFLAIVSHELRTPLNAILGWSEMLRSGAIDTARQGRALKAIHESARHQSQLIDELLDVSRIMSGKLRLDRSIVDWSDVLRKALESSQPAVATKQIDITSEIDPDVGAFYGDAARLQQIVLNLVTNAVKFTPNEGSVRLHLHREGDVVELTVADNGQGIAPDFLPWVFEPFRQADGSSTRTHGGLGLGLSIVKHLVEAHGGTVTGHSHGLGLGSTFRVRLPMDPLCPVGATPAGPSHSPAPPSSSERVSLKGLSVLVVDDDERSREVVTAYLQGSHASVLTAASAPEALEILRQSHVDVLLADIAMPGQDGYDLVRAVRAMQAPACAIPAAALTAFARAEDSRRALEAGFQMHLKKPIGLEALVSAVADLRRLASQAIIESQA